MKTKPHFVISGKRKTAVARASVFDGSGLITYNGLDHGSLPFFHRLALTEPMKIAHEVIGTVKVNVVIQARGGGKEGQIQAARLALAKALVQATKSIDLRKAFLKYDRNLLVADTRRKEVYKPGDSKARAKRQKSYR